MTYQNLFFASLLWIFLRHPFFVSVCEIEIRDDRASVQITHKIFWDDLEASLKTIHQKPFNLLKIQDTLAFNATIKQYLDQRFELNVNQKTLNLGLVGWEIEEDAMWVYQEATNVRKITSLQVRSAVLMDYTKEQTNLVHVKKSGKTKSLKLDAKRDTGTLTFN